MGIHKRSTTPRKPLEGGLRRGTQTKPSLLRANTIALIAALFLTTIQAGSAEARRETLDRTPLRLLNSDSADETPKDDQNENKEQQNDCPNGEYFNGSQCQICHPKCGTCSGPGPTDCITCPANSPANWDVVLGECRCKPGNFMLTGSPACHGCHQDCLLCAGRLATQCMVCKDTGSIFYSKDSTSYGRCYRCSTKHSTLKTECAGKVSFIKQLFFTNKKNDLMVDILGVNSIAPRAPPRKMYSGMLKIQFPEAIFKQILEMGKDFKIESFFGAKVVGAFQYNKDYWIEYEVFERSPNTLKLKVYFNKNTVETELMIWPEISNYFLMNRPRWRPPVSLETPKTTKESEGANRLLEETLDQTTLEHIRTTPLIAREVITVNITGKMVPDDSHLKIAGLLGTISRYLILGVVALGAILVVVHEVVKPDLHLIGTYFRFVTLLQFICKIPLFNTNFGSYLLAFFDEIYKIDIFFMRKIWDEKEYRIQVSRKIDEYLVPVLIINSIPVPMVLFLVSSLANLVLDSLISASKAVPNKVVQLLKALHFLIVSLTLLNVMFYGLVAVMNHLPYFEAESDTPMYSLGVAMVCLLFVGIEFFTLFFGSKRACSPKKRQEKKPKLIGAPVVVKTYFTPYQHFARVLHNPKKLESTPMLKYLNFLYFFRFFLGIGFMRALD